MSWFWLYLLRSSLVIPLSVCLWLLNSVGWSTSVQAQILPDGTTSTQIGECGSECRITAGTQRGPNLFHSFELFNVGSRQSALFVVPNGIDRIFSRVTGENVSRIRGTLGVNGNADLILMNPNGIFFGSNTALKMGEGAFTATTANAIQFESEGLFRSSDRPTPFSLLNVAPSAFLFQSSTTPQPIRYITERQINSHQTLRFEVSEGQKIRFVGGPLTFQGDFELHALKGSIELLAIDNPQSLGLTNGRLPWEFTDFLVGDENQGLASITFSEGARAIAEGGTIQVMAHNLILEEESRLSVSASSVSIPGDLNITATGTVEVQGLTNHLTGLFAQTNRGAGITKVGGRIVVNTQTLILADSAIVSASSFNNSQAGDITVNSDRIILQNGAVIQTGGNSFGEGGEIHLNSRQLILENSARIVSDIRGTGEGGDIFIQGLEERNLDLVFLSNGSEISTSVAGNGGGGNVNLNANFLVANRSGNSDITANANADQGGLITLNLAGGLFGMVEPILGDRASPDFVPPSGRETNDITAFSQQSPSLDGEVIINTPGIDPDRRLPELLGELEAPQLRQRCYGEANRSISSFIDVGQGGLPSAPGQAGTSLTVWEDLRPAALDSSVSFQNDMAEAMIAQTRASSSIVEAQDWVVNADGEIVLVADARTDGTAAQNYSPLLSQSSLCRPS